jgi:hypothetical protein
MLRYRQTDSPSFQILVCRELYPLLLSWNGMIGLWHKHSYSDAKSPLVFEWEANGIAVRPCNAALRAVLCAVGSPFRLGALLALPLWMPLWPRQIGMHTGMLAFAQTWICASPLSRCSPLLHPPTHPPTHLPYRAL